MGDKGRVEEKEKIFSHSVARVDTDVIESEFSTATLSCIDFLELAEAEVRNVISLCEEAHNGSGVEKEYDACQWEKSLSSGDIEERTEELHVCAKFISNFKSALKKILNPTNQEDIRDEEQEAFSMFLKQCHDGDKKVNPLAGLNTILLHMRDALTKQGEPALIISVDAEECGKDGNFIDITQDDLRSGKKFIDALLQEEIRPDSTTEEHPIFNIKDIADRRIVDASSVVKLIKFIEKYPDIALERGFPACIVPDSDSKARE